MITKVPPPLRPLQPRPAAPPPPPPVSSADIAGTNILRMGNRPSAASASRSVPIDEPSASVHNAPTMKVTDQADVQAMLTRDLYRHIKHGDLSSVEIVLGCGANPNARHLHEEPPLLMAVRSNRSKSAEIANRLLEQGADANAQSQVDRTTPLIAAIQRKQVQKVAYLLDRSDINIHRADSTGISAYGQAQRLASGEEGKAILRMIERHYQLHRKQQADEWHEAGQLGDLPMLKKLYVRDGASMVDCVGRTSYTALWKAAKNNHAKEVVQLLAWGADVGFHNGDGVAVIDVARNHGATDVVAVLEAYLTAGLTGPSATRPDL